MAHISITYIYDYNETCGGAGAEGCEVAIDGENFGDFLPVAHCYNPVDHPQEEVMAAIMKHLGHSIEFHTQSDNDEDFSNN